MDTDFLLGLLRAFAEDGDVSSAPVNLPVTLCVGGVVISGEIISEDEYFAGLSQLFPEPEGEVEVPEGAATFSEAFRSLPNFFDEFAMTQLDEGTDPQQAQAVRESMKKPFIHLRNTHVWTAEERFFAFEGAFWRGKLTSIDGFWLGQGASQM